MTQPGKICLLISIYWLQGKDNMHNSLYGSSEAERVDMTTSDRGKVTDKLHLIEIYC